MIVRVAHFRFPDEEHRAAAEVNGSQRVWPALASQPGAHAIYYGRIADLEGYSISLWEDREKGEAAAVFMNSRPLLPGHTPDMLPTPDAVAFYETIAVVERDSVPTVGRIGSVRVASGRSDAADEWARTKFTPMLEGLRGLCQAYLLRPDGDGPDEDGDRVSLTFWETREAMASGGRAIAAWHAAEASAGGMAGEVGTDAEVLSDLTVGRAGW